ncbi:MAG: hypothetical protein P9M15_02755 [Candidatus Electryoneaceae bacterium]|nr:hypothetical protein [Candidatus Electryoneaceae bacterium]
MSSNTEIQKFSQDWLEAKAEEDAAKARRIEIEEAVVRCLGKREEGSKTHDLGTHKVTITGVVNRTLDKEVWESIKDQISESLSPVTYVPKLDVKGIRWLQTNDPDTYRLVAKALTIKPGKTNIKVIVTEKEKT